MIDWKYSIFFMKKKSKILIKFILIEFFSKNTSQKKSKMRLQDLW